MSTLSSVVERSSTSILLDFGRQLISRHLKSNAQALDIHLSHEQVRFLDNVLPFDYGQPMSQASHHKSAVRMVLIDSVWFGPPHVRLPRPPKFARSRSHRLRSPRRANRYDQGPRKRCCCRERSQGSRRGCQKGCVTVVGSTSEWNMHVHEDNRKQESMSPCDFGLLFPSIMVMMMMVLMAV